MKPPKSHACGIHDHLPALTACSVLKQMTLCLNLPVISFIWTLHRGPGGLPRTNRSWNYPGKSVCALRSSSCPPGSAGCSPGTQSSWVGWAWASTAPTWLCHKAGPAPCPAPALQQPGLAGPSAHTLNLFHAQKRERKLSQIWFSHYFGKGKAAPAIRELLKSCSGILQEWLVSGWGTGWPSAQLTRYSGLQQIPLQKAHLSGTNSPWYQSPGQYQELVNEWLILQLTHRVRLKARESFEERGKKRLIFKVKKEEIQVHSSADHKACRKLAPFTSHPPLLITQLRSWAIEKFFALFIPPFHFSRHCWRHCKERWGFQAKLRQSLTTGYRNLFSGWHDLCVTWALTVTP